ncbi:condensation domain-containing protein [Selenomonas ruminantium]|uniref:condensation domain-containing protein n=1 Tax=Selenomonas ruminantium TaxID=971 RepID=UPI0026EA9040|nr:condensation domain-containing protein [Selenomonas ruminantium]
MKKMQVTDLAPEERQVIEHFYGNQVHSLRSFSPKQLIYMRDITDDEREFFSQQDSNKLTGSLLQMLYKIKGKLVPLRFNRALNVLSQHDEALRMNFCDVGKRILAVVFQERMEMPEIVYRNLEKIKGAQLDDTLKSLMEADMRRDFDPKSGPIMRFSVYHTGEDEYAVVVTGIQAMLYNFDVRKIFCEVLDLPYVPKPNAVSGLRSRMSDMAQPVTAYWKKILIDLPPQMQLPYMEKSVHVHRQEAYLAYVPHNIFAQLREKAKSNKIMLMSILQTAWGLLLEQVNHCNDAAYCLVVPRYMGKDSENSAQSIVPMRLAIKGNPMIQTIVTKAFQQFVISQPYASLGREGFAQIIGQQDNFFDHFLNFHDFFLEGASYSAVPAEPMGRLVVQNSWDTRDIKLGIGFRHEENQLVMTFSYDNTLYSPTSIEKLFNHYVLILQQMLADWSDNYSIFMERLEKHTASTEQAKKEKKKDTRGELQNYLFKLDLLQECENGVVQLFVENSQMNVYFEGDSLPEDLLKSHLIFLVEGKAARSMENSDGWYNALDIQKENCWLNELVFLEDNKARVSVEVLTEQAKFLLISKASVQAVLKRHPSFALNMLKYTSRQLAKYQRLWVQS